MNKNEKTILTKIEASKDIFTYLADAARLFDERSVGQKIKEYFVEHGYSSSEVFKKGGLDRSYGYDILSNRTRNPGRDKILMLAIGMELPVEQAQDFITELGYGRLDVRCKRDSIVVYGLYHGFLIRDINEVLYTEGLEELK